LGADLLLNYRTHPDWGKEVAKISGTGGVDHVVEVGGGGSFMQSVRACRSGGKISLIGILSGVEATSEIFPIVPKSATVFGVYVGSREMFEDLNRFLGQTRIRPVIDKVFPFEEAKAAYAHLASGAHLGKVVIRL
jgi:NADPH:quinone reductase-like Zn-dependent oxidoreductase